MGRGRPRQLGPDDIVIGPNNYVRQLVAQRIPKEELQAVQSGTEAVHLLLGKDMQAYHEWRAVSHTFVIQRDGDALLTVLFERTAPG